MAQSARFTRGLPRAAIQFSVCDGAGIVVVVVEYWFPATELCATHTLL